MPSSPEYNRNYYLNHRAQILANTKAYAINNPLRTKNRRRDSLQRLRAKALKILGGKCLHCGFDDPRALQIDHIAGGGRQESKEVGSKGILLLVLKDPTPYQLLCANCNWIKRVENNEVRNGGI